MEAVGSEGDDAAAERSRMNPLNTAAADFNSTTLLGGHSHSQNYYLDGIGQRHVAVMDAEAGGDTGIGGATAAAMAIPFRTLTSSIASLQRGISSTQIVASRLTRRVFTILLSYRVPMDVCWLIFEFLVYTEQLKQVLLKDLTLLQSEKKGKLSTIRPCMDQFMECDRYLSNRKREVSEVVLTQTSFPVNHTTIS